MKALVDEAINLADRLSNEAIWSGNRCTWMQRILQEVNDPLGRGPKVESMGADIYSGATGVALFLAAAHRESKKDLHRATALGAMRHALALARRAEPATGPTIGLPGPSVFSGGLGVAWAGLQIGNALNEPSITNESRGLLSTFIQNRPVTIATDVLGGDAGAILALLDLHRLGEPGTLDYARFLGDRLVSQALRQDGTVAWPWNNQGRPGKPLTGYSHGTSGYAQALLELANVTNDDRYREAALGALEYERRHFAPHKNNWPDFREREGRPSNELNFMLAWCHGAPGIGASRTLLALTAEQVLPDIRAALESTMATIRDQAAIPDWNCSCCHGLFGNIDCAFLMAQFLQDDGTIGELRDILADRVALFGAAARNHEHAGFLDWPTGRPGYTERSLLKGLAGTGLVLLRLGAETPPASPLFVGRQPIKPQIEVTAS